VPWCRESAQFKATFSMTEKDDPMIREALTPERLRSVYSALARRYDAQHCVSTAGTDELGRRLVVENTVRSGDSVLDAGSGTGSSALLAAQKSGSSGHVTLLDFCGEMLDVARTRAQGCDAAARMTFVTGDLLKMPFADDSFDAVLSTYSVCPLYSPEKGALELFRVLKHGGRLGVAHSHMPQRPIARWLAQHLDDLIWRVPGISMGCRAVSVLPALEHAGARTVFEQVLGMPLHPFLVFVVEKPARSYR
jgi:ubiquinone/menaquinone biosynthesis C-methylase UbiE